MTSGELLRSHKTLLKAEKKKKLVRQAIIKQALAGLVIVVCAKLRNTLVPLCGL